MFGSVATVVLVVGKVWCTSGAPVNFPVTTKPGDHFPVLEEMLGEFAKQNWTLTVPMTSEGHAYRNGRPPCPTGDDLNIEFEHPSTS